MLNSIYKLTEYVKLASNKIVTIPSIIYKSYQEFRAHLKLMSHNLRNLRQANINLAYYHLNLGNLNDVLIRCFIITRFVSPGDQEAYNIAALVYYLKGNLDKARQNLKKAKENADNILDKLINYNTEDIPFEIFEKYREYNINNYIEDKNALYVTLSHEAVNELFEHIEEIEDNLQILDINPGAGRIADAIKRKIGSKGFYLTAVECSRNMREYLKDPKSLYDKVLDYKKFMESPSGKYDMIFSVLGFEYVREISDILQSFHFVMNKGCLIALAFRVVDDKPSYINAEKNAIIYNREFLLNKLDVADFKILAIKEVTISAKKYIVTVCAKKKE